MGLVSVPVFRGDDVKGIAASSAPGSRRELKDDITTSPPVLPLCCVSPSPLSLPCSLFHFLSQGGTASRTAPPLLLPLWFLFLPPAVTVFRMPPPPPSRYWFLFRDQMRLRWTSPPSFLILPSDLAPLLVLLFLLPCKAPWRVSPVHPAQPPVSLGHPPGLSSSPV